MFCSVPDDFKVNPGAVEALAVHPTDPDKVMWTKKNIGKKCRINWKKNQQNLEGERAEI